MRIHTTHPARVLARVLSACLTLFSVSRGAAHAEEGECALPANDGEHYVVWWGQWERGAAVVAPNGLVARRFDDIVLTSEDEVWSWQSEPSKVTEEPTHCLGEPGCERRELISDQSLLSAGAEPVQLQMATPTELTDPPQGYEYLEVMDWSVQGVAATRAVEGVYRGDFDHRDIQRSETQHALWLDDGTATAGAESVLGAGEEEALEELCDAECVFTVHAAGGWTGGEFAGIRLEINCDERDEPLARVIALFERDTDQSSYWDHDLAQIALSEDQMPDVIADHWPPPPQVTAVVCDNRVRHRQRVQAFGWSTVGPGPVLDELLGD